MGEELQLLKMRMKYLDIEIEMLKKSFTYWVAAYVFDNEELELRFFIRFRQKLEAIDAKMNERRELFSKIEEIEEEIRRKEGTE